jgi:2,3-bisphosphoglycerate-dependent phosphoglycerate mutase
MFKPIVFIVTLFLLSCKTSTYYIVRHAEKESSTMTTDVALSEAGRTRAMALKDALPSGIHAIYSTNFVRTRATIQPYIDANPGQTLRLYSSDSLGYYIDQWKMLRGKTIIVGHSNTVDDIVNGLTGQHLLDNLPDSQYGDLFVVTVKRKKAALKKKHFGL